MNKNFLLILLVIAIVGVVGGFKYKDMFGTREPVQVEEVEVGIKTYKDPEGVFTFKYPEEFSVTGREERILARVRVPREYMPGTNFSEAELTIGWESGATDESCGGDSDSKEAAAGNLYETYIHQQIHDGDCYEFAYTIHSTNIGNYDPNQGVKEFDKEKVKNDLNKIIQSFKYLLNSD